MTIRHEDLTTGKIDLGDITTGERLPPVHPGEILDEDFLKPAAISQDQLADDIGLSPLWVSEIVRGERPVGADTALRLARYFGTSAEFWMNLQTLHDLHAAQDALGDRLATEVRPRVA